MREIRGEDMKAKRFAISVALGLTVFGAAAGSAAAASCPQADTAAVASAVQAMFNAAAADDMKTARTYLAQDFYIYDNGMRFDADAILGVIEKGEQAGAAYTWNVTEPQVHFACDTAWITYVNKGTLAKAGQQMPATWLESAILRHDAGGWIIQFMHSTRVPTAKPN